MPMCYWFHVLHIYYDASVRGNGAFTQRAQAHAASVKVEHVSTSRAAARYVARSVTTTGL
jgi:hypothetical protein